MDRKFIIARIDEDDALEKENQKKVSNIQENNKPAQKQDNFDRYSIDRVPSYLRKEDEGGITSSNIAALKGEKKDPEAEKEMNRRLYANNYNLIYGNDKKQVDEIVKEVTSSTKDDYVFIDEVVQEDEEQNFFATEKQSIESRNINFKAYHDEDIIKQKDEEQNYYYSPQKDVITNVPKQENVIEITKEYKVKTSKQRKYEYPPLSLLNTSSGHRDENKEDIEYQINIINKVLMDFNIPGAVSGYTKGPTLTLFEVKLEPGVNVRKVTTITQNLQMELQCKNIRIEAPLPGKAVVGIEVPNIKAEKVIFGDLLVKELEEAKKKGLPRNQSLPLNTIVGLRIDGKVKTADIHDMPHGLIAGKSGGGKTVCIYSLIFSLIFKTSPEELKLVLVDPKGNELNYFEDIPHLATPIINDAKLATAAMKWCADEMDRRYDFLKVNHKRELADYNEYARKNGLKQIPYIVIIIDEFADIILQETSNFETNVKRLTAKARSAGIHLLVATQRPSTDIIKGAIKANISYRFALAVNTFADSTTILDHGGADKLIGKGDMLVSDGSDEVRVQGAFISDEELDNVYNYFHEAQYEQNFLFTEEDIKKEVEEMESSDSVDYDPYIEEIARFVFRQRKASANQIQKTYNVGYNRADKIINALANIGIISKENIPGKAREVLISDSEELERILSENSLKVD